MNIVLVFKGRSNSRVEIVELQSSAQVFDELQHILTGPEVRGATNENEDNQQQRQKKRKKEELKEKSSCKCSSWYLLMIKVFLMLQVVIFSNKRSQIYIRLRIPIDHNMQDVHE